MTDLAPLESLYDGPPERGVDLPLPSGLRNLYGRLEFPPHPDRSYCIGNFVTSLDGVVSLNAPGQSGGGEISGFNLHDKMVMGLLRALADAVVVGAGTLRAVPDHLWTADFIYPALADTYQELRASLGLSGPPLNVIVTTGREIDTRRRIFQSGEVPVLIVTTTQGAKHVREWDLPPSVQIATTEGVEHLSGGAVLEAVNRSLNGQGKLILIEGGPQLMGSFFAEQCLDELFLTVAPQIAGRDGSVERPGLVAGQIFAPEQPLWGTLTGVKRGGSHLFLRYAFRSAR